MPLASTSDPAIAWNDDEPITFREFCQASNRIAHGLRSTGVRRGDCVVVALENCPELLACAYAALRIGAYFTPVNPQYTRHEFAHILGDCRASALLADHRSAPSAWPAADEAGLPLSHRFSLAPEPGFRPLAELMITQPDDAPEDLTTGEMMFYTSGTTGQAKAVRRPLTASTPPGITPDFLVSPSLAILQDLSGPHLTYQPMFFKGPLIMALGCLHHGRQLVLKRSPLPAEALLDTLQAGQVASFNTDPHMLALLLRIPIADRAAFELQSLRRVIHSGAPCPIAVKRQILEWWGNIVWEVYGTTEGTATVASPEDWRARPGTAGRPLPGGDVQVLDPDGTRCPPGAVGEVFIKSPPQLPPFEYLNDPAKTAMNRRGDYFTVGDLGYLDSEGWLFLTGRRADVINVAGLNVYAAEVENVIRGHADVADVAVIGVRSEQSGEEVKALVELADNASSSPRLTREIAALCRESLAPYKRPVSIEYRPALPRTERGKVRKEELRAGYLPESRAQPGG